jgi:hypothetical protein
MAVVTFVLNQLPTEELTFRKLAAPSWQLFQLTNSKQTINETFRKRIKSAAPKHH